MDEAKMGAPPYVYSTCIGRQYELQSDGAPGRRDDFGVVCLHEQRSTWTIFDSQRSSRSFWLNWVIFPFAHS